MLLSVRILLLFQIGRPLQLLFCDLLFINLWTITKRMIEMGTAYRKRKMAKFEAPGIKG